MSESKKNRTGFEMNIGSPKETKQKIISSQEQSSSTSSDVFCMAIMGDFSGRDQQQRIEPKTIAKRRFISVDRDNIEELMSKFDLNLRLSIEGVDQPFEIPVKELDDFHPDQLYENVEIFSRLRQLRNRLESKNSFAEAAREIQGWLIKDEGLSTAGDSPEPAKPAENLPTDNLLDSVFEASSESQSDSSSVSGSTMVDNLVRQVMRPYVEAGPDPRQEEMIAAVDQAISSHMQYILHHPDFQAMEATWRGLDFLVSQVETGSKLKLFLLDVSRAELDRDLATDEITSTGLYQRFCDPAPGDEEWGVIVGNYKFTDKIEDMLLLLQIGAIARQAKAPFIAAANETLIGCESFAITPDVDDWLYSSKPEVQKAWRMLRQTDEAGYLALVTPGFLLRTPYGKKSKPIESFKFEEMPTTSCHSCYLWGNGAYIKALQMARAFAKSGWQMNPEQEYKIENLPMHYFDDDGEMVPKPCAEILLTEQGGRRIIAQGLIPLWSVKNSDSLHSSDFNFIAE
ncbi:MAG: type VI secretion system contractile sheath large subunit [Gammaproteobacteria bacterium]|nr:type VI secretion system contractile sheath large subunit [Gammaproteobacteria bacterium]MDH5776848.1 type VI secretion system contractile sheath large subunit [Gammaproteobacteria bacterium]